MKIKLHHVNVCSKNVPGLEEFYRDVLDLQPEPSLEKGRILDKDGYPGKVAFLSDGETQFHLAEKDYGIGFRTGPGHQSRRARTHRLPHRRHRGLQEAPHRERHPVFRLWGLGHEGLGADLLLRSRRQRHRGAPGAGVTAPHAASEATRVAGERWSFLQPALVMPARVAGIQPFTTARAARWIPGTSPGMTRWGSQNRNHASWSTCARSGLPGPADRSAARRARIRVPWVSRHGVASTEHRKCGVLRAADTELGPQFSRTSLARLMSW